MSEKEKKVKELSAEEVLQKFDKESDKRELTGVWGKIISHGSIIMDSSLK